MYRIALSLLALLLAHGMALLFRIQPAVSLWFPPSGVAIALTFWLGPVGALLTGFASVFMAPLWGSEGWTRWVGLLDALEPLVAWFFYRYWLRGSLNLTGSRDALMFLVSTPFGACLVSALAGCFTLSALGKIPPEILQQSIAHWWLGNALGTMVITPLLLILPSRTQGQFGGIPLFRGLGPFPYGLIHPRRLEVGLILVLACVFAGLTVSATRLSIFSTLQFSLLGSIPVVWAVARFGVRGGVLTASFSVIVTLVSYLLVYPNAMTLPVFPVESELLHTHKLMLLLQTAIALVGGMAITDREASQVALAVEQVKRTESEARAYLNERLMQVMRDSQHLIQQVTDTIPQVLYVHDLVNQQNLYVNRQVFHVLGYEPETLQAMGKEMFWQLLHPDDWGVVLASRDRFERLKDGEISEIDYRLRHASGEWRWLHCREMVFARDAEGQPTQILGSADDMTERKYAETERYQLISLIESSSDLIALATLDGQVSFLNAAGQRLLGLTNLEQVKKTAIVDCFEESDRPFLAQEVLPVLQNHGLWKGELYLRNVQTGQRIPMLVNSQLVRDSQTGIPIAYATVSRDISDRKQSELALSQANERFRLAVAALSATIYDWDCHQDCVERTEGLYAMLDTAPEEVEPTYEWWWQRIHPEDRDKVQTQLAAVLHKLPDPDGSKAERYNLEYRFRHKKGHYIYIHDQGILLRNTIGEAIRMVGNLTDISERKLAAAQSQQLASIVENSTDFIGIADLGGNFTFVNQAGMDLVGLTEQTFQSGMPFLNYFAETDREWIKDVILPTVFQYSSWQGELQFKHFETGELIPVFFNLFVISDPTTGKPISLATVTRDFRERKRIEQARAELLRREKEARKQAESASRMKDEFLAIVSHELRSPLNGILGWSQLLRSHSLSPEKIEQALASIERNARAQTQLIEDLLDISRIIRGQIRLTQRPLNLTDVIQTALDTIRPTAEAKSIRLMTQFDGGVGVVLGDSERLQQVVWNLLSNAVKFTPAGGWVDVRLSEANGHARIGVVDSGKGISPEFLPYVFDRFRQADATTTRSEGGLGLGLAIVRNLVELHGGRVEVASAGVGQGATFSVDLPLLPGSKPQRRDGQMAPLLPAHLNVLHGLKVLVVDDEADTREFLLIALEQAGAIAIPASSVQEALEALHHHHPQVLLSDIGMPQEDGYTLIRRIRALPPEEGGQIPAAALTAYVRGGDRQAALAAGFQMHIPKPIDPNHLLQVVAQLAGSLPVQ